jgi:RNA polymerase sigma-70 factor (ECF subfamily)
MLRRQKWKSLFVHFNTNEEKEFVLLGISEPEEADYSDVRNAVDGLPDKYRIVTVLYYFNGLDVGMTSEILKIPKGTVKYQLHRAREMLKRRLEPDGR